MSSSRPALLCTLLQLMVLWSVCLVGLGAESQSRNGPARLVQQFKNEKWFTTQLDIAKEIATRATLRDVLPLEPWLNHKDRRMRGNAAYVFAKLGDPRGFDTIVGILNDYSLDRIVHAEEFTFSWLSSEGESKEESRRRWDEYVRLPETIKVQINSDRYFAVHLLGLLRDPRSVEILVRMLPKDEVGYGVPWALGEIGDRRAIPPLIAALSDKDAVLRVASIGALEKMRAVEAIPALEKLATDTHIPHAGDQVPVGKTAEKALEALRRARKLP